VEKKTFDHLRVAQRNRDLARALLTKADLGPDSWGWVAVVLFYSAVHYVNAYLWERYLIEPANHGERSYGVREDRAISACQSHYDRLRDQGYRARYDELFSVTEREAQVLLQVQLRAVEAKVMQALGQPSPTW